MFRARVGNVGRTGCKGSGIFHRVRVMGGVGISRV